MPDCSLLRSADIPPVTDSENPSFGFTPKLPYLLSALVQWIQDNGCTPMLVAHVDTPGVMAPKGYSRDGMITFNISEHAVQRLVIDEYAVGFAARFAGRHFDVYLPLESLAALFAREHPKASAVSLVEAAMEVKLMRETSASAEQLPEDAQDTNDAHRPLRKPGKPRLRLVE